MSSQINYFMQAGYYATPSPYQPAFYKPSTSFQPRFSLFKPRFKKSYFQIRCPKFQNFKEIRLRKKSFKVTRKIKKINKIHKSDTFINPCLSPHNTTQFIINCYETEEVGAIRFTNPCDGFGSMMGLVKNDSLNEKQTIKSEENNSEIEEMVQMAKIEQDPFRLFIIINRLANMVKEKDEQILVLERKISGNGNQQSANNQ